MADVAFIGLGNMGGPMAINLIKAGHAVVVFDLSQAACDQLQEAGASVAGTAAEAAVGMEYVISMLPAGNCTDSPLPSTSQVPRVQELERSAAARRVCTPSVTETVPLPSASPQMPKQSMPMSSSSLASSNWKNRLRTSQPEMAP